MRRARVSAPGVGVRGQVGARLGEHGLAGRGLHPLTTFGLTERLLRGLEPERAIRRSLWASLF